MLDGVRRDSLGAHPIFEHMKAIGSFYGNIVAYAPYTTASMPAILSGIYGSRNGVNSYYSASRFRRDSIWTLPELLEQEGFSTAVDINNKNTIPSHAYQSVSEYDEFDPEIREDLFGRHRGFIDTYIKSRGKSFLALHNLKTHSELIGKFRERYSGDQEQLYYEDVERNRREYASYVEAIGEYTEDLVSYLHDTDFFADSLLVVLTDHGCSLGEVKGERMYGTYLNDYTIKSFAYFIGPEFVETDVAVSHLFRTVDIMPTILEICSLETPRDKLVPDGLSMLGAPTESSRLGFVETAPLGGPSPSPYVPSYHGVVSEQYKLLVHSGRDELEFLTLSGGEWVNVGTDTEECRTYLSELCKISPIVNRLFLAKHS